MRARFWHERWEQNQIGFHQQHVNTYLQSFWGRLQAPADSSVFVPLCGKSKDMLWLRAQGFKVLGIELSAIAVRDFFDENNLQPVVTTTDRFERWEADGLVILVGDFFQLQAADLVGCSAVYDRASLIALPVDMREQYVEHFLRIVPVQANTLLITIEYDQSIASGPPFAVRDDEVQAHYAEAFRVELLLTADISDQMPGLAQKGVTHIDERVYVLTAQSA